MKQHSHSLGVTETMGYTCTYGLEFPSYIYEQFNIVETLQTTFMVLGANSNIVLVLK